MHNEPDQLLAELDTTADLAIEAIISNNTSELQQIIVKQVQLLKKITSLSENVIDRERLRVIKNKIEQQQLLVAQSLDIVDSFFQILSEYRQFSRSG